LLRKYKPQIRRPNTPNFKELSKFDLLTYTIIHTTVSFKKLSYRRESRATLCISWNVALGFHSTQHWTLSKERT